MHAKHITQKYNIKAISSPLVSCINEIYAKFWSINIQWGITNDGLLHSTFQHQLVVLYNFVWWRLTRVLGFFSDSFYRTRKTDLIKVTTRDTSAEKMSKIVEWLGHRDKARVSVTVHECNECTRRTRELHGVQVTSDFWHFCCTSVPCGCECNTTGGDCLCTHVFTKSMIWNIT